jgi:hypothetical protein
MKTPPLATSAELKDEMWTVKAGDLIISRHPFWAFKTEAEAVATTNEASPSVRRALYRGIRLALDTLEDTIYDEQADWIRAHFGQKAADNANYGWGVSGGDDYLDVATKVYGHGVLRSFAKLGEPIVHEFRS